MQIGPLPPSQHVDIVPNPNTGPGPIGPPLFPSRPNYLSVEKSDQPLYTNVNSASFGQDLLKISPENQIIGFPHQLNYSQQNSPPAAAANPTVSMSRLNPRAPDFSVSYAKQQPPHQTHQQQIFHPQTNNPNMAVLTLATSMNKQYPRTAANGHPRWPYGPTPQGYQPQLQEVAGMFANHNVLPNTVELLSNFENGGVVNSPSMSPSSPANNPTGRQYCYYFLALIF